MARELDLLEIIDRHMGGPFIWGVSDCCLGASAVFNDIFGVDPLEELRGTYSTAREAVALIGSGGVDFLRLGYSVAAYYGLRSGVASGSFGLISDPVHHRIVGGINIKGPLWAAKADDGYAIFKADHYGSWLGPTAVYH